MIFYQATLPEVTLDMIEDCILKKATDVTPLHLFLPEGEDVKSLRHYLEIVEQKRQTLSSPYKHSFICLELAFSTVYFDTDLLVSATDHVSRTLSSTFDNDLYILSFVYKETGERFQALVILSSIERSLDTPSLRKLPPAYLQELIKKALPHYDIHEVYQSAIYVFSNEDDSVAYDGVIHLSCELKEKIA